MDPIGIKSNKKNKEVKEIKFHLICVLCDMGKEKKAITVYNGQALCKNHYTQNRNLDENDAHAIGFQTEDEEGKVFPLLTDDDDEEGG